MYLSGSRLRTGRDHMELGDFIKSHPRNQRTQVRRRLAAAHGVAEVTVRSWANGQRRHPCSLAAVEITETITDGRVTRYDIRPDVFGRNARPKGIPGGG